MTPKKQNNLDTVISEKKNLIAAHPNIMTFKEYLRRKRLIQIELLKVQKWVIHKKKRIVAVFEGRDAAGKGGTIKRFTEHLNPRGATVVALEKPNARERNQWYFQRYIQHLPSKGHMVFFDRSWYNRAGVEKVMGFCNQSEYLEFLKEAPPLETMWVNSGIHLFKYWCSVTMEEQRKRLGTRETDPLKHWKLSPVDLAALNHWGDYTKAKETMFKRTDTKITPWTVINMNDKKRGRINCMVHFLSKLDYPDKATGPDFEVDITIVSSVEKKTRINKKIITPKKRKKPNRAVVLKNTI